MNGNALVICDVNAATELNRSLKIIINSKTGLCSLLFV